MEVNLTLKQPVNFIKAVLSSIFVAKSGYDSKKKKMKNGNFKNPHMAGNTIMVLNNHQKLKSI